MDHYRIKWSNDLLIGKKEIDNQHRTLIESIDDIPEERGKAAVEALASALAYANTHFTDEEQFMEQINYPELYEHQREHKRLIRTLIAYKKEFDKGEQDLYNFKQFMLRWVRDHIMDTDRKIGEWQHRPKN